MSVDMNSQASDDSDYGEDNSDYGDDVEDDDMYDYYDNDDHEDGDKPYDKKDDPEYFELQCLTMEEVEKYLSEQVDKASKALKVSPTSAKVLLKMHNWVLADLLQRNSEDKTNLLVESHIIPPPCARKSKSSAPPKNQQCPVCLQKCSLDKLKALSCGHYFCKDCWTMHFSVLVKDGVSTGIQCMANNCNIVALEDFVSPLLVREDIVKKFKYFTFKDHVQSHYNLCFCPGRNCEIVMKAEIPAAKRATCSKCNVSFCFRCGNIYHAPTDCETIKRWLTKCRDDSETANYISAHTKDCPKCSVCIEKNGGCNHMQCFKCKHDFCWMCLGDWKNHGSEYYECSRYKENPNIANESVHVQAREALKKYLFYFERWENHSKSLRLEQETLKKINQRIEEKVMNSAGTWIDWQYLLDAASLLAKCRYTLQYTYPYAYYMDSGPRKKLFEYQQAQLEAEIENLSWKVERAETTDRGDLENQMDIAEKRRQTLLKDFLVA
ncbi:potential E3 ubiquitin-protein ligase ariadne-2-like [Ptychodera flava]|uniref:potential E3 ubiquitin-protein ligase ariadne-2-like n=1 Tax=Ptychodera flava TaxID=63121 RepID=UPI00396A4CE1